MFGVSSILPYEMLLNVIFSFSFSFRQTKCEVEIYERCGTTVFGERPFPVKNYRKTVYAFCDKSSPLRESK